MFREVRAAVHGAGRSSAAVGERAQLLRGAHDALGGGAVALHDGRLRLQGVYAVGHAAQAGGRAQPHQPRQGRPPRARAAASAARAAARAAPAQARLRQVRSHHVAHPILVRLPHLPRNVLASSRFAIL